MSLLQVENLNIHFSTMRGNIHAVRDLSFSLERGESLGIVGESGCGKSITSKALLGLLPYNSKVSASKLHYEDTALLKLKERSWQKIRGAQISMIFQDPMTSLNPSLSVEYQLSETLKVHTKLNKNEIRLECLNLLEKVGIPDAKSRLGVYPHQLSGGMCQRVMIAQAIACRPKLLIADEPTTALDVTIQAQILALLKELQEKENMGLILITHDLSVVAHMSEKIMVMYAGECVESGSTKKIIQGPEHPYTHGLLKSLPSMNQRGVDLFSIPGRVPDLMERPQGCQFAPRCPHKKEECTQKEISFEKPHLKCLHPIKGELS